MRRVAFYGYDTDIFRGQKINILKYDDSIINKMSATALATYLEDANSYTRIEFKGCCAPSNGWAVPYVTGKKYRINWGYGLDWMQMKMELSNRWKSTDLGIYFIHNHTDIRAKMDVYTGKDYIENMTLVNKSASTLQTGDFVFYNDTPVRELHFYVNGKNSSRNPVAFQAYRCVGSCLGGIDVEVETTLRYWSNVTSWPSGVLPVAGEDVEIKAGWNMIYDIAESPKLDMLEINGRLTFLEGADLHLHANYIFVRAGELNIGNSTDPFTGNAKITLYGNKKNQYMVYTNAIEAGDKILVNTGNMSFYGLPR